MRRWHLCSEKFRTLRIGAAGEKQDRSGKRDLAQGILRIPALSRIGESRKASHMCTLWKASCQEGKDWEQTTEMWTGKVQAVASDRTLAVQKGLNHAQRGPACPRSCCLLTLGPCTSSPSSQTTQEAAGWSAAQHSSPADLPFYPTLQDSVEGFQAPGPTLQITMLLLFLLPSLGASDSSLCSTGPQH